MAVLVVVGVGVLLGTGWSGSSINGVVDGVGVGVLLGVVCGTVGVGVGVGISTLLQTSVNKYDELESRSVASKLGMNILPPGFS